MIYFGLAIGCCCSHKPAQRQVAMDQQPRNQLSAKPLPRQTLIAAHLPGWVPLFLFLENHQQWHGFHKKVRSCLKFS